LILSASVNIFFNVNHTVDADAEATINSNMDQPDLAEMKSEPGFEVELVRGSQTLGFTCSFIRADEQSPEDEYRMSVLCNKNILNLLLFVCRGCI
jgi:hypothetical protein